VAGARGGCEISVPYPWSSRSLIRWWKDLALRVKPCPSKRGNLRLFLVMDDVRELSRTLLRLEGESAEIRADDLRFTLTEVRELLAAAEVS